MTFPQAERIALAVLEDLGLSVPPFGAGSRTPDDLQDVLANGKGFVRIVRGPGPCDDIDDQPTLRIDVFHLTLPGAEDLGEAVRVRLMDEVVKNEHGCIDRITCPVGYSELPWPDPGVVRLQAIYQALVRRTN